MKLTSSVRDMVDWFHEQLVEQDQCLEGILGMFHLMLADCLPEKIYELANRCQSEYSVLINQHVSDPQQQHASLHDAHFMIEDRAQAAVLPCVPSGYAFIDFSQMANLKALNASGSIRQACSLQEICSAPLLMTQNAECCRSCCAASADLRIPK